MTCSLADLKLRLRLPLYPLAASRTARRCFLPWTERLTRAMNDSPYRRPRSRSTCFLSPPSNSEPRPRRRVRLLGFFSSRWARNALRRRILPVPVAANRLAAPRWVFIFGIGALRSWAREERRLGRRRRRSRTGAHAGP